MSVSLYDMRYANKVQRLKTRWKLTWAPDTACRSTSGMASLQHKPDDNIDKANSTLEALAHCLEKGKTWASENNVDVDTLVEKRIYHDMNVSL
jgi:hypothetical protein